MEFIIVAVFIFVVFDIVKMFRNLVKWYREDGK